MSKFPKGKKSSNRLTDSDHRGISEPSLARSDSLSMPTVIPQSQDRVSRLLENVQDMRLVDQADGTAVVDTGVAVSDPDSSKDPENRSSPQIANPDSGSGVCTAGDGIKNAVYQVSDSFHPFISVLGGLLAILNTWKQVTGNKETVNAMLKRSDSFHGLILAPDSENLSDLERRDRLELKLMPISEKLDKMTCQKIVGRISRSAMYWLNGNAGSFGKSTIAQSFSDILSAKRLLGASFFCSRDLENLSDIKPIAFQLAHRYPEFRTTTISTIASNPDVGHESMETQLGTLLIGPLKMRLSTVIVIDALECKLDEPDSLILWLLADHIAEMPKVKFFITGRPEHHIHDRFYLRGFCLLAEVCRLHGQKRGRRRRHRAFHMDQDVKIVHMRFNPYQTLRTSG